MVRRPVDGLLLPAILLGAVQGLTEFLPVSSTAHLAALPVLVGWTHPLLHSQPFDVALHFGTLIALLWAFSGAWRELARGASRPFAPEGRTVRGIAIATLPALVAGGLCGRLVEERLRGPNALAAFLAAGAALLWAAQALGRGRRAAASLSWREAALIGCAQALAILPGMSRSGMTIAAGLALGLRREEAARYAFLLSGPVIAAAVAWEARRLEELAPGEWAAVAAGVATAAVTGLAAIRFLLACSARLGYLPFVWYRFLLAALLAIIGS
jgi:undecaprenyl-diphosphatase